MTRLPESQLRAMTISIGDELLSGKTIDSNNAFISQQFALLGLPVIKKVIIGDIHDDIFQTLDIAFKEADVITLTGGLGPTHDDITKTVLCDYFNVGLKTYPEILEKIKSRFKQRNLKFSKMNTGQAEYPENAELLENTRGTAQGMYFKHADKHLFVMPGVPMEMEGLVVKQILPRLKRMLGQEIQVMDVHTIGIPESQLYELCIPLFARYPEYKIAYLPKRGMVSIRVSRLLSASDDKQNQFEDIYASLSRMFPEHVYGRDKENLASVVGELLLKKRATVVTVESCTGGLIANLLTDNSGSSSYFKTGYVTYANETKMKLTDVQAETLSAHGAVSEETVSEMLSGGLLHSRAEYAIAVSGIAGPDGGSEEKPVGTVYIGVANSEKQKISRFQFGQNRIQNKKMSAHHALNQLRLLLLESSA